MKKFAVSLMSLVLAGSLAVSASAFAYDPGLGCRSDKALVPMTDETGKPCDAVILDSNNEALFTLPSDVLEIVCTDYADKDDALEELADMLDKAHAQIESAKDVSELTVDMTQALELKKKELNLPDVTMGDLVVSDLFDVSVVRNEVEMVHLDSSAKIKLQVQTNLKPGEMFFVLHNYSGSAWRVAEESILDEDGLLTIVCEGLSPIAIVVNANVNLDAPAPTEAPAEKPVEETPAAEVENGPSPETGILETPQYLLGAVLSAALGVLFFKKSRKQTQ